MDGHCAGLRFLAPALTLYLLLASSELRAEQPRSWNAFAAAKKIALPPPNDGPDSWLHHPIDRFILKGLDEAGLAPSPPATPRILIRRLSFNLVGLPPSPELLEKFTADPSDTNYRAIVDDLLASPNYGERWARHWLDVARYGESNGFEYNEPRRNAWPYRDWVIQALNDNFPYDQFAREQIAGKAEAIGFLVAGVHRSPSGAKDIMSAQERHDGLEEMVGTLSQAFLGITVQCARCHDHPTDPIPTADYYRLAAALAGTRHPVPKTKQKSYSVVSKKSEVMHVFHRGDTTQPREEVSPGGLSALANPSPDFALDAGSNDSERRKKLAEWITHPDNDLFTRVIVNRIWHYHFGTGIVSTPSDFGKSGGPPTHPELLDWLAHWFRTNGYSLKKLHHLIVTSQSYRQPPPTARKPPPSIRKLGSFGAFVPSASKAKQFAMPCSRSLASSTQNVEDQASTTPRPSSMAAPTSISRSIPLAPNSIVVPSTAFLLAANEALFSIASIVPIRRAPLPAAASPRLHCRHSACKTTVSSGAWPITLLTD